MKCLLARFISFNSPLMTHVTRLLLFVVALLLISSCKKTTVSTPAPSPELAVDTVALAVMQVRQCSRLYVTEMQVHKLVTHVDEPRIKGKMLGMSVDMPARMGQRRVAIPIDVTIKAYVDLEQFTKEQVHVTDSTVFITLPDPKLVITASRIDNNGTRQFIDPLRSRFSDEEITQFAAQGTDSIEAHISQLDIESKAQASAARQLLPVLQNKAFRGKKVVVQFRKHFNNGELLQMIEKQ